MDSVDQAIEDELMAIMHERCWNDIFRMLAEKDLEHAEKAPKRKPLVSGSSKQDKEEQ